VSSLGFVVGLAIRRAWSRASGTVTAAVGIAAATAVLGGIFVGGTIAQDRSVAQAIERLSAASRSVRPVWFGVPASSEEEWVKLDRAARAALTRLPLPRPVPIALVRESTVGGVFVGLAAVDGLAPHVQVRSGRLPRACRPSRCEVLRLRGAGRLPDLPGLRVVQVGTATLRSRQLFGDFLAPTDNALADRQLAPALQRAAGYHRPAPAPLVVAEGVAGLVASAVLERSYRSYAWVQPLRAGAPRAWEIDAVVEGAARARAQLEAESASWALVDPGPELREAQRATTVAGRRLLLVGGEAAALLVAFAILAAGAMRRELDGARRRLTWHGARRWQPPVLAAAECTIVGSGGAILGWVVGAVAGATGAALAGAPVGDVLRVSILGRDGLLLGAGAIVVSAAAIAAAVSSRRRSGRLGALELLALAAVVVVAVVLAGGSVDDDRLANGGGPALLLLLLPGLVGFAVAVATSRALPQVALAVARRGRAPVRLVATSLARGVGAAGTAVAFLALAIGLAFLAESYRATLARGERDQAAYRVPADIVVREDLGALVRVLDAASLGRYAALAGDDGAAYPVARLTASAGPANVVSGVSVLGLPGAAVASLPLWREAWGARQRELAEVVSEGDATELRSDPLPDHAIDLVATPSLLGFRAVISGADGSFRSVELAEPGRQRARSVQAPVPPGSRLVALQLVPPRLQERGADAGVALRGTLGLRIRGVDLRQWVGQGGVTVSSVGLEPLARLDYAVTPGRIARLRPPQPTDATPPSVVVTPALGELAGGVGGTLPLRIGGERVNVTVASVVERFPGTSGETVIGGLGALRTAIDAEAPGSAPIGEVWLEVPDERRAAVTAALDRRPFAVLDVVSRARVEADARRDPLGHGTLIALLAAAVVALALAVVGLVLAVRADLRDEAGELAELEAQGASPSQLRRVVRVRALIVGLVGLAGGMLAGGLLALLVTRVVRVTARATAPEPPLVTTLDLSVIGLGGIAIALLAAALVAWATRSAFADPRGPGRLGGAE